MEAKLGMLAIMGQGYVGLPLAMRAVEVGYDVVGYEINSRRVDLLRSSRSYVEDVTDGAIAEALATNRYLPTSDAERLAGFDVALITVPTPLREGRPDLTSVEIAGGTLARCLTPGALVVLESTTYPGTTEEVLRPRLEEGSGLVAGKDFHLGYSPERIDPGNRSHALMDTPKIVSGVDAASLATTEAFYQSIVDVTVPVSRPREAELAKLLENTFRHVNIALVNEVAMFAAELGVDVWEALDAAATKPFGFMRFNPGPGVGGHCLPIDPSYLSWRVQTSLGRSFRFVELANDINDHMPDYVVQRLAIALNRRNRPIRGGRILLLGLAYKANTSDLRESPALAVARRLLDLDAIVCYVDDHITNADPSILDQRLERVVLTGQELAQSDAVVILADHDHVDYEMVVRHGRFVLDTRHRCRGRNVEYL